MATLEQELTGQFYRFELLGRGGQICPTPVAIEPPYRPFPGYFAPQPKSPDDGRRHTFISGAIDRLSRAVNNEARPLPPPEEEVSLPTPWEREEVIEFRLSLPRDRKGLSGRMEHLLGSFALCRDPVAFEIMGAAGEAFIQIAAGFEDALRVEKRLAILCPDMTVSPTEHGLLDAWQSTGDTFGICECGLEREFMLPLSISRGDPYLPLLSTLASLEEEELGVVQVIFRPAEGAWGREAFRAITDGEGGPFFVNRPDLVAGAKAKFARPLYAAVIRFASSAGESARAWEIIAEMMSGFVADVSATGNRLIPLSNDGYDSGDHERDLIYRQSRRLGMLLNQDELSWLVRFPDDPLTASILRSDSGMTRAAPDSACEASHLQLGFNEHAGSITPVYLSNENRFRHTHVIGASGTGKSTLLYNMIRADIEAGAGVGVLDPHGDLIQSLLGIIPEARIKDVILIDPSDEEWVVGFNILSAHSDLEKNILASDLVSIFARLSTSWGDQMGSVFQNAVLAFLESTRGGTLSDLRRFLLDKDFRSDFLKTVEDPEAVFYWEKGFPQLGGNKSIGPILTRLESFLSPKPIRYMVSEKSNRLDFADIMDSGKILLISLPLGLIGRENSHLLGSLFVAKFQQMAMSRQALAETDRRPFWLYIDEFQNFATPSMAEILSGARKYKMGLTLAHQDLTQLRRYPELSSAVLTNTCTRIVFRPGDEDAHSIANGFAHFDASALMSLSIGEAVCRIGRNDADFNLSVSPSSLAGGAGDERRSEVIESSRRLYGRPKAEITAEMAATVAPIPKAGSSTIVPTATTESSPQKVKFEDAVETPPEESAPAAFPQQEPGLDEPTKREKPPIPKALGIGGEQHTTIQRELKQVAESLGFRATIEKQLPGTLESTDLLLDRDGFSIAVEITVTNTLDYEIRNIGKCLRAGVSEVAVVAMDAAKLQKLAAAATNSFEAPNAQRLRFFSQTGFIDYLQTLVTSTAPEATTAIGKTIHKGWKVKTTVVHLSPEEMKERETEAAQILAAALRKKAD